MDEKPWKTSNWFVSPWNYEQEVVEELNFPSEIKVHDITLRDGEQQAGIVFSKDDKVRIAEALAEAGVHRIEAGMPAVSPSDEAAIKEIVKRDLGPQIFAFSRCMIEDVKRAIDCGVSGVVMEIHSSEHIIANAYRWPLTPAIDLSIKSTAYAHEQGLEIVFFPIDFTRAEINWALDLITRVAQEGHMDGLALVDTFGVISPHAMKYLVRNVRARVKTRLEAHFHMDFGLGIANTIMALGEGVEVMHTTVLGIGERAGNVPMEETVMSLLTLYGVDIGLDIKKFYSIAKLVRELSGQSFPTNKPVVGDDLFKIESGIITSWLTNCGDELLTELFPYRWDLVGQNPVEAVLGKGSGLDSIKIWLDKLGVNASEEQTSFILQAVKQLSLQKKKLLSEEEFREIVEEFGVGQ